MSTSPSSAKYTVWLELDTATATSSTYTPQNIFDRLPRHEDITHLEPGWEVQGKQKLKHRRRAPSAAPSVTPSTSTLRSQKDRRYGPIHIDWYDLMPDREKTFTLTTAVESESGSTTLPSGTLHLFRHPTAPPLPSDDPSDGPLLGILALPAYFTPSDLLDFLSPLLPPHTNSLAHIRVLRDSFPDRSLVLLKFRPSPDAVLAADEFTAAHNGRPFQDASPEICKILTIDSVLVTPTPSSQPPEAHPPAPRQVLTGLELPTCPVCLDRMDSALTGLITVPCTHTFHCSCLSRWPDSRCPVCRASTAPSSQPLREADLRRPPLPAHSGHGGHGGDDDKDNAAEGGTAHCASCSSTSDLWICLICGNLGCGRYAQAHAAAHYQHTRHAFALEVETQRVWDYEGDVYVHRLIRNRVDGKVVELAGPGPLGSSTGGAGAGGVGAGMGQEEEKEKGKGKGPGEEDALVAEKMEAMGIEYGLLLSAQLETQRTWYEEKLGEVERRLLEVMQHEGREAERAREGDAECEGAEKKEREKEREEGRAKLEAEIHAREKAQHRATQAQHLARTLQTDLLAERAVSSGLLANLSLLRGREAEHAKEKQGWERRERELEEELRDLMIFLETRGRIESGEIGGLEGGSVGLPPMPTTSMTRGEGKGTPEKEQGKGKRKGRK
ncbi:zf-UBP-domain-containing protein [Dacryopinax primogenitus]|uniref:Zf-UBP-domain-containing protein n=1 Tax=Dacryopinax primogenitus (strain DJM 731) TaxID=1858805 RepID=M5G5X0_DACPD|nr:zf-UBP-domain-containing protein [Dacryopinax primogenitus]EJU03610.1 zf-UBP-domain-containing protein [Dacryopinax primogenitus]